MVPLGTKTHPPWLYDHRVKVVKLVTDYESKIAVNKSPKQQRNLVTKFISGKHSRQEFLPLVGPAIDKAKCEPIHLGNNCWQEWNKQVMTIALARTNTDPAIATVDQLPFDCCFRRYFRAVKNQVRSCKLYKKILKWFREDRKKKNFQCRYTGEETRIEAVRSLSDTKANSVTLYALAYSGLKLRNATSRINTITDIDQAGVDHLEKDCQQYCICSVLFLNKVTLSMWTVGFCVPHHTKTLFKTSKVGLGINTMQGREAKHQKLANFAGFSLPKDRWQKDFFHQHMSLIWLRQQNPYLVKYSKSKVQHAPKTCYLNSFCFCRLPKATEDSGCRYCQSPLMAKVAACVTAKKKLQMKWERIWPPINLRESEIYSSISSCNVDQNLTVIDFFKELCTAKDRRTYVP